MLRRRIPADAYSLKSIGIDVWRENFLWPVSDTAYGQLADIVLDQFDAMLVGMDAADANLVLCDPGYCGWLIQHLHALLVSADCARRGDEILMRQASAFYQPDWEALANPVLLETRFSARLKLKLRQVVKGLVFSANHSVPTRVAAALGSSDYWCIGSWATLLGNYLVERNEGPCAHIYPEGLFGAQQLINDTAPGPVVNAINGMLERLKIDLRDRFGLDLDSRLAAMCWIRRLGFIQGLCGRIRRVLSFPRHLLCTEPANTLHRVVARVAMDDGAQVTAFAHGNEIGLLKNRMHGYVQMSMCHQFVCPSRAAIQLYGDIQALTPIGRLREVRFLSTRENQFRGWHRDLAGERNRGPVRVVMVLGFPMNPNRYVLSQGDFFLFQLELELQVLRQLKAMGLTTIYKVHPERISEARGIFEKECDEVVVEPFEKIWTKADAFVFPSITSTTFGFALCTPRPIAVIDIEGQRWNPAVYPSLSRRCTMVAASFGPANRPYLDQDALGRAFGPDTSEWDDSFVPEFMYP